MDNVILANWEYFTSGKSMDKFKTGKWMVFFNFFDARDTIRSYCEKVLLRKLLALQN